MIAMIVRTCMFCLHPCHLRTALYVKLHLLTLSTIYTYTYTYRQEGHTVLSAYVHGKAGSVEHVTMGKAAAVVQLHVPAGASSEALEAIRESGRKVAMHVIAATPKYVTILCLSSLYIYLFPVITTTLPWRFTNLYLQPHQ